MDEQDKKTKLTEKSDTETAKCCTFGISTKTWLCTLIAIVAILAILKYAFYVSSIPSNVEDITFNLEVEVPVDLEAEKNTQKSVDEGHSPWRLDTAFVAQVFVSLKISPEGIEGEYPIKTEDLKVIQNTGEQAVIEVSGDVTPIRRVYLEKVVRQDPTGIWTVVGYDPIEDK